MSNRDIAIFQVGRHSDALLPDGTVLVNVHSAAACAHRACVLHRPTNHTMRDWPIRVRRIGPHVVFERVCPCGTGHPDPDQEGFWVEIGAQHLIEHGCCGHCAQPVVADG